MKTKEISKPPRFLETNFRKELGKISPYLSLIDIASKEFIDYSKDCNLDALAKKHGHMKLVYDHIELSEMSYFATLSHLAFIHSRAERFCDEFRCYQKDIYKDESSSNLSELDKLRRTVFNLHSTKNNNALIPKGDNEMIYAEYTGSIEMKIYDYYRKIRNVEFHGGINLQVEDYFNGEDLEQIKKRYNCIPHNMNSITIRDVILYSQAWQNIARNICRKAVSVESVVKELCYIYKHKNSKRRDNAITNKLQNEYLQELSEIDIMRELTKGWLA